MAIFFTYPLQLFPCIDLINNKLSQRATYELNPNTDTSSEETNLNLSEDTVAASSSIKLRIFLVVTTYIIAMAIPNVQQLISLIGALVGALVALIIPPLLELYDILSSNHRFSSKAMKRYLLLLLGVTVAIIGTVSSIREIWESFEHV